MPIERATRAFKQERLNCAQSVLKAFQESHGLADGVIEGARGMGGGRAEGGVCGALHAATRLTPSETVQAGMAERFKVAAGSDRCREIRRAKRLTCEECVRLAAELVLVHRRNDPRPAARTREAAP